MEHPPVILAPIGWIIDSAWWGTGRPWFSWGYDRWAEDFWRQRAPVPAKRSKRY